jgi:MFS family permease
MTNLNAAERRFGGLRLATLALIMLLPSLAISITNVALPSLATAFGAASQEVQWVVISYLVVVTALLVTVGRLGDQLGKRRVLLAGVALFAVASAVGAFAPSLWALILARGIQGVGAATMMALTIATVADVVPKERTGVAMGLIGTTSAIGTALGPSLGGLLIAASGWPVVFGLMAVAGLAAVFATLWALPRDQHLVERRGPFDLAGTVVLVTSVATFALATTLSPLSTMNGLLFGIAAAAAVCFVVIESTAVAPLVDLRLLANRTISAGLLAIGIVSAIMMTTLVVGPFYLSGTLGLDPLTTGLVMSVGPTVSALVGVPAGRLVDRSGPLLAVQLGLGGVAAGSLLMTVLAPAFGAGGYVASLILTTAGYALFQAANNTAVMGTADKNQRGVTSALLALGRNLGLVVGASALSSLFVVGAARLPVLFWLGNDAGLRLTFVAAAMLAGAAMVVAWWGSRTN